MIYKHVFGIHRLLEEEWWKNRHRKRYKSGGKIFDAGIASARQKRRYATASASVREKAGAAIPVQVVQQDVFWDYRVCRQAF